MFNLVGCTKYVSLLTGGSQSSIMELKFSSGLARDLRRLIRAKQRPWRKFTSRQILLGMWGRRRGLQLSSLTGILNQKISSKFFLLGMRVSGVDIMVDVVLILIWLSFQCRPGYSLRLICFQILNVHHEWTHWHFFFRLTLSLNFTNNDNCRWC